MAVVFYNQGRGIMAGNANLQAANKAKNDEFYTQYDDIKKELLNYTRHFKDKVIYCNCDDHNGIGMGTPKSNFLKYLADNFHAFGIKKVISTHYERSKKSTMYILDKDNTGDGIVCAEDISEIQLSGDGDFRSPECIELLKQADIVITNPPFSLFREYVAQLVEHKKKFLIIGNKNAITYKEIFPLIKGNKIWLGYGSPCNFMYNGKMTKQVNGLTRWYTNLDNKKRNEFLDTGKKYYGFEDMYPKYDNYDAININKTADIPMDYNGVMGVPITFIDKYCPEQFEIIGATESEGVGFSNGLWKPESKVSQPVVNKVRIYKRIFIRKKKGN